MGMNQDTVTHSRLSPHRFIDDVVVVPTRHMCNRLGADWTVAALLFPEVDSVRLPRRVFPSLRRGVLQGRVSHAGSYGLQAPLILVYRVTGMAAAWLSLFVHYFSVFVLCCPEEVPVPLDRPLEVPVAYPPVVLLRVPPSCPSPQGFENGRIHMDKGCFCRCMLVKVGPSPYFGVEVAMSPYAVACLFPLMTFRMLARNVCTFFFDGRVKSFPLYLRTFCPRKSNPSSMCVILVFSSESSNPRSWRNAAMRGLTSISSTSFEFPVIMKSSA